MEIYFNNRNRKITCKSNLQLIQWMRKHDAVSTKSVFDFMEVYKERKMLFENINLSTISPQTFVSGLIDNKIISVLN